MSFWSWSGTFPFAAREQLQSYFKELSNNTEHIDSLIAASLLLNSCLPAYIAAAHFTAGRVDAVNFNRRWFVNCMFYITVYRNLNAAAGEQSLWSADTPSAQCDVCRRRHDFGETVYLCDRKGNWSVCTKCSRGKVFSGLNLQVWRRRKLDTICAQSGLIYCDKCSEVMQVGDIVWWCKICHNGDFELCTKCYENSAKRCGHSLQLSLVTVSTGIRWADKLICDGCRTKVYPGSYTNYCKVCNSGNYDLCATCADDKTKRCGHVLTKMLVKQLLDKGADKQDNYGAPADLTAIKGSSASANTKEIGKQSMDARLRDSLLSSILTDRPSVKWSEVAGLEQAKRELRETLVLPIKHPQLFAGKRQPKKAILMYGPPGTGKSYLAKAVATEVKHALFAVSASDLTSKWQGESEGLVRQLFHLARERRPSIIFLDEIDAIGGSRDKASGGSDYLVAMKTELLVQMDGVGKDNSGILFLAATNRPWELDPAIRRRFQRRIHIPLADESARRKMFEIYGASASIPHDQLLELAVKAKGLSGSDIANATQEALMYPIRRAISATYFREVHLMDGTTMYTPCEEWDAGAKKMGWDEIPDGMLMEQKVEVGDFVDAIRCCKASVAAEEVERCVAWTEKYGSEGA